MSVCAYEVIGEYARPLNNLFEDESPLSSLDSHAEIDDLTNGDVITLVYDGKTRHGEVTGIHYSDDYYSEIDDLEITAITIELYPEDPSYEGPGCYRRFNSDKITNIRFT